MLYDEKAFLKDLLKHLIYNIYCPDPTITKPWSIEKECIYDKNDNLLYGITLTVCTKKYFRRLKLYLGKIQLSQPFSSWGQLETVSLGKEMKLQGSVRETFLSVLPKFEALITKLTQE